VNITEAATDSPPAGRDGDIDVGGWRAGGPQGGVSVGYYSSQNSYIGTYNSWISDKNCINYMRKGLGIFLENREKPAAT